MASTLRGRLRALPLNVFPCYFGTGARVTYIAEGWREVRLTLPLTLRTRNYVGTIFGGSMYGAVDPIYMLMLIKNLGPDYIVWDKAAVIRFKRPGRGTLRAVFTLAGDELEAIRAELTQARSLDRVYTVDLVDATGAVCASVEKTLYIRRKNDLPANARPAAVAATTATTEQE